MIILLRGLLLLLIALYLTALTVAIFFSNQMTFHPQQAGDRDHPGILKLNQLGWSPNLGNLLSK